MNSQLPPTPQRSTLHRGRVHFFTLAKPLMCCVLLALGVGSGRADVPTKDRYPNMAPLEQYLMPRDAEIALARSSGPESVTRDAEVLVLTRSGFKELVPGHNGFVCLVQRSWSSPMNDPEFWNPKERGPTCYNPAAAQYCVPLLIKKTELVIAGKSKPEISSAIKSALSGGELPPLGPGAMCFMMAKEAYLGDAGRHWHPHLMFFLRAEPASQWAANVAGSPVFASTDDLDQVTTFMVPVSRWSDGTPDVLAAEFCAPTPNTAKAN